jgi:hypothetical protein
MSLGARHACAASEGDCRPDQRYAPLGLARSIELARPSQSSRLPQTLQSERVRTPAKAVVGRTSGVPTGERRRPRLPCLEALVCPDAPPDDLLDLDDALERLADLDPRAASLVKLRLFAGLTLECELKKAARAAGVTIDMPQPGTTKP